MKPPYAESTVYQKYRKTGIEKKKIRTIKECLNACSDFYKVIELDEALMIARKEFRKLNAGEDVSKAELEALVPIFERDSKLDFYLELESELYDDGKDVLLLIDKEYLCVKNSEFTEADSVSADRIWRTEENHGAKGLTDTASDRRVISSE